MKEINLNVKLQNIIRRKEACSKIEKFLSYTQRPVLVSGCYNISHMFNLVPILLRTFSFTEKCDTKTSAFRPRATWSGLEQKPSQNMRYRCVMWSTCHEQCLPSLIRHITVLASRFLFHVRL